jgi:uncharacterized protein
MIKWLLVVGVVVAIYVFFIKKKPTLSNKDKNDDEVKNDTLSNDMVECSTCGVYCEIQDALLSSSKYYCCAECLEKA